MICILSKFYEMDKKKLSKYITFVVFKYVAIFSQFTDILKFKVLSSAKLFWNLWREVEDSFKGGPHVYKWVNLVKEGSALKRSFNNLSNIFILDYRTLS